jgi:hypothetical protein
VELIGKLALSGDRPLTPAVATPSLWIEPV